MSCGIGPRGCRDGEGDLLHEVLRQYWHSLPLSNETAAHHQQGTFALLKMTSYASSLLFQLRYQLLDALLILRQPAALLEHPFSNNASPDRIKCARIRRWQLARTSSLWVVMYDYV
jgi:hypothetical protein